MLYGQKFAKLILKKLDHPVCRMFLDRTVARDRNRIDHRTIMRAAWPVILWIIETFPWVVFPSTADCWLHARSLASRIGFSRLIFLFIPRLYFSTIRDFSGWTALNFFNHRKISADIHVYLVVSNYRGNDTSCSVIPPLWKNIMLTEKLWKMFRFNNILNY